MLTQLESSLNKIVGEQAARIEELEEDFKTCCDAIALKVAENTKQEEQITALVEAGQRMLNAANFGQLHNSAPYDALKEAVGRAHTHAETNVS